ncbi:MAG TPA: glycogen debranching N-terminal domain-containing protein [Sphingomicrobium sp.]|nr:glycogen debranching N-terminal domain-containing protein [Sphingomicrobium sp.]
MAADEISILDGNEFVVSDRRGDVEATPTNGHGLFLADTRFLSRWVMTINGARPTLLSVDDLHYFRIRFFMALATGTTYVDSDLSVLRERAVGHGFHEDVTLVNHGHEPLELEVRFEAEADFADLFEVRDKLRKKGSPYRHVTDGHLALGYRRERFVRETRISATQPAEFQDGSLFFQIRLEPHAHWTTCVDVVALLRPDREAREVKYGHGAGEPRPELGESLQTWLAEAPKLVSSWAPLEQTYRRSLVDLAALRFRTPIMPGALPAAGLPWFMTVFGRDSLITSLQALPFTSELAATTLRTLAVFQGQMDDPFRDEEPGKILHEIRWGEMTAFEERPHSPYYGSADSTPLFLILLDEYERWTGDRDLVLELEGSARAAANWIVAYGDRDGDGYIEYERRNRETGLENQCWKDSGDSIAFADGTLAPTPLATCELQGYAYDARRRTARLAREIWNDPAWASRLEAEAEALRRRFNEDFWLPERGFFALALDGQKRKVDSLTSNIGHLLWSGIAEPDKAERCVHHLMSDELFSGWGVRTMAMSEGSFNPIGYHVGTVWPHDCSLVAWGLRRYGYRAESARVALAMLEAAELFHHRLPEAFAGYSRAATKYPVEYPTACSPQAWATGAPLLLLRTLLGLEPVGDHLIVDPALPHSLKRLELLDIPGRWGKADAFGRTRA